jgi:hypothetical protein
MSAMNLATVFGPNILRGADENDMMAIVRDAPRINRIMVHLIENANANFLVGSVTVVVRVVVVVLMVVLTRIVMTCIQTI